MKFFTICLFIASLFSNNLASSLAFASPETEAKLRSSDKEEKEPSSSSSTQMSPSASSSATSLVLNKNITLPLGLPLKLSEFLTQSDLGALKQVTAYDPVKDLTLKTNGQFAARYNLNNLNTLQKTYKKIYLRNKKESIRNLLLGLLPMNEGIPTLEPSSYLRFVFPSKTFGANQDQELKLQRNSALLSLDLTTSKVTPEDIEFIVKYFPNLEDLNLTQTKFASDGIPFLSELKNLKSLNLSYNKIPSDIFEKLSSLSKLENLYLSQTVIIEENLIKPSRIFSRLTSLDLNWISSNERSLAFMEFLECFPELTSLKLRGKGRSNTGFGIFAQAAVKDPKFISKLTSLKLGGNVLGTDEISVLAQALKFMPELTSLDLSDTELGADQILALAQAFADLKFTSKLTSLSLVNTSLGPNGALALVQILKFLPKLTSLNLKANSLGDPGVVTLAQALKSIPELTSLDLSSNGLGAGGISALAQALEDLKVTSKLTSLDLIGNNLGANEISALARALKSMPELTSLNLNNNKLDAKGIFTLTTTLKDLKFTSKLTSLYLAHNKLDPTGAGALVQILEFFPELTSLCLTGNEFFFDGIFALVQALKNLKVTPKLTWLDLAWNPISIGEFPDLVEFLRFFPNLTSLNLDPDGLDNEELSALKALMKKHFPGTKILFNYLLG